jgi:hypothetical protein
MTSFKNDDSESMFVTDEFESFEQVTGGFWDVFGGGEIDDEFKYDDSDSESDNENEKEDDDEPLDFVQTNLQSEPIETSDYFNNYSENEESESDLGGLEFGKSEQVQTGGTSEYFNSNEEESESESESDLGGLELGQSGQVQKGGTSEYFNSDSEEEDSEFIQYDNDGDLIEGGDSDDLDFILQEQFSQLK